MPTVQIAEVLAAASVIDSSEATSLAISNVLASASVIDSSESASLVIANLLASASVMVDETFYFPVFASSNLSTPVIFI